MGKKGSRDSIEKNDIMSGNIDGHIKKLTEGANSCVLFSESQASDLQLKLKEQASLISERCDYRISEVTAQLTSYVSYVYLNTNHRIDQVIFHHSPSLFGIIAWLVVTISNLIIFIKDIVALFHIVDLIKVSDILAAIWPKYRAIVEKIYAKVSEASQQLGFGVDGLIHLIQATQSSITILGGVLGKDWFWSDAQFGEQALKTAERIAVLVHQFENNPSYAFRALFASQDFQNKEKINTWWDGVSTWITKTTETAEKAIKGVDSLTYGFMSLASALPGIVKNNIPDAVWDGLEWTSKTIDQTLLPAIANIDDILKEVNKVINDQRNKASELAYKLAHPGDVMLGLDLLSYNEKKDQEEKIDDVASRKYNEDTDKYELDDAALIAELDKTSALFATGIAPLTFMSIEEAIPGTNPEIIKEPFETWFVGGYLSTY